MGNSSVSVVRNFMAAARNVSCVIVVGNTEEEEENMRLVEEG
jgi:hypothetical protein